MSIVTNIDEAVEVFFPQTGEWYGCCLTTPKAKHGHKMEFLPCHLDDQKWLVACFRDFCRQNRLFKKLPSEKEFADFCETRAFQRPLHEYKMKVVHWQIDWMLAGGGNWIYTPEQKSLDAMRLDQVENFRKGIMDTLKAVGLSDVSIEEGLETYFSSKPEERIDWKEMMMWKEYKFLKRENKGDVESFEKYKVRREGEYYQLHPTAKSFQNIEFSCKTNF